MNDLQISVIIMLVCDVDNKSRSAKVCVWVRKRWGDVHVCPCVWCIFLRSSNFSPQFRETRNQSQIL